jgi:Tfp pilus assembly protein PilN
MITTNLATRPFYNESAVRLWLALAALLVLCATIFNVAQWAGYSRSDAALAAQASADEARARELRGNAGRLRGRVESRQIQAIAADAQQANDLIRRRTFSWTDLFNRFEATIPPDVRITSVRQRVDKAGASILTIAVLARDVTEVNQFIDNLENEGAFVDPLAHNETINENGELEAVLETVYRAGAAQPSAASRGTSGLEP